MTAPRRISPRSTRACKQRGTPVCLEQFCMWKGRKGEGGAGGEALTSVYRSVRARWRMFIGRPSSAHAFWGCSTELSDHSPFLVRPPASVRITASIRISFPDVQQRRGLRAPGAGRAERRVPVVPWVPIPSSRRCVRNSAVTSVHQRTLKGPYGSSSVAISPVVGRWCIRPWCRLAGAPTTDGKLVRPPAA